MGNRATVFFTDDGKAIEAGIYLHWNGGAESVYTFLDYAKSKGVRTDAVYCMARMCQIIGNYFGGTLSLRGCAWSRYRCGSCQESRGIFPWR